MLKYKMTAAALKAFSLSPQTKRGYRFLGNTVGQQKRIQGGLDWHYIERAKLLLDFCHRHQAIQPGDRLLEIGTGWVHWESTVLRLFHDVEITLLDVWDNRHFAAYKLYCQKFAEVVDAEIPMEQAQHERVHMLLAKIQDARSFEEVYSFLNFTYVVNPTGTLDIFPDQHFALIFSSNVLEHIEKSILPDFIRDFYRILRPGGHSIQQIDLGDHLSYYDRRAPVKNYLRYSDKTWKRFFENDVQYFNRVQKSIWLELFQAAGLELAEMEAVDTDLTALPIDQSYQHMNPEDLRCWTLRVVHTRPRT